ncbi:MAG TPA: rhomboid family intramembrane serine protease [Candidatus Acidoferrales bacterium]|nr:rhomboid family intramembrane serine protease [Candidatus Acidoferrales bacterium]
MGEKDAPRPKLCPSCGTLVGATATRCHQCGASLTFSLAAASKSLSRLMPATSPATYAILGFSVLIYVVSLLVTIRMSGSLPVGGGVLGLLGLGAVNGDVLQRLGASLPYPVNIVEPWRLVTAIFLHGSVLHIVFNMWVLMDIGPQIEELYGSARFLFIYVGCGVGGFVLSSGLWHFSVGGSGAIVGLVGVLLALTTGRQSIGMRMLRSSLIRWLIYLAIWGFVVPGVDNSAHIGGLVTGFILGKILVDRPPATVQERRTAQVLGWVAALAIAVSFAMAALTALRLL